MFWPAGETGAEQLREEGMGRHGVTEHLYNSQMLIIYLLSNLLQLATINININIRKILQFTLHLNIKNNKHFATNYTIVFG